MLEGFAVIFLLLSVIVIAAITVIVGLALVRRPAPDWHRHLRAQRQAIAADSAPECVATQETTLDDLLDANTVAKNGYFDADRLPGVDRFERLHEKRHAAKGSS